MPFVEIQTNLPSSAVSEDFMKALSACVAAALGKPEQRMHLVVNTGLQMLTGGSCSPCVIVSVGAIGVTDSADQNKQHSAKIFDFLTKELGLSKDRIAIRFLSVQPHQVGKQGTVLSFL
ncbi:D-dopachrome decarboxylase [Brachionichthys hirsutus]|uniref:D-dopachrome decarboxylase n=1 Tax=Brachionichthys hirsutus TaxID=412623 RepID=UPI003604B1C1